MDIRKFAAEPTGRLHLRDANDELMYADAAQKKPIAVNLYGPASKQYSKAQADRANRQMDSLKSKGKSNKNAEQVRNEGARFLADCTTSFENLEYEQLAGDELAMAVYSDVTLGFIADQIAVFIGDWSNFTKASPKI